MSRPLSFALLLCAVSTLSGCTKTVYVVEHSHEETLRDHIDAHWFTRTIADAGGLQAVELVYCPIQPSATPVCRTAIIWRRDQSALTETTPGGTAAAP